MIQSRRPSQDAGGVSRNSILNGYSIKMHILFLTPRFPYPPLKGDTLRTYHQMQALSKEHRVTLLSISEGPVPAADYRQMQTLCERVVTLPLPRWRVLLNLALGLPSELPLQVAYFRSPAFQRELEAALHSTHFDIVHATLIRMLPYVWRLRRPPVVVDLIDSLTLNLQDRRQEARWPVRFGYEVEYERVRRYEQAVVGRFPSLVVSSQADKFALGSAGVAVIPNGVDTGLFPFYTQEGRDTTTLVFTGNMGYGPNEDAVLWFVAQVWPLLRARHAQLRFQVVGTNPGERVRALAGRDGIEVPGRVPDVAACLGTATVAVAPMQNGSGIQNKVLEAMSTGTPVVATRTANRGVQGTPGRDLLVADSPADFCMAVSRLLADADLRQQLAVAARSYIEGEFRWTQHAQRLVEVYSEAVARTQHAPGADRYGVVHSSPLQGHSARSAG